MVGTAELERRLRELSEHRAELARLQAARLQKPALPQARDGSAKSAQKKSDSSDRSFQAVQNGMKSPGVVFDLQMHVSSRDNPKTRNPSASTHSRIAEAVHEPGVVQERNETATISRGRGFEESARRMSRSAERDSAKLGALMGELEFELPDDQLHISEQTEIHTQCAQPAQSEDQTALRKAHESALLDERWTKDRRVSALHWHADVESIVLAAYGESHACSEYPIRDADGVVAVWDAESGKLQRTLFSTAPLTSLTSHPVSPALVICGTTYGDIVGWDMRSRSRCPALYTRTESSASVSAIYAAGASCPALVSSGCDGSVFIWTMSNLNDPVESFTIRERGLRDIRVSGMALPWSSPELVDIAQHDNEATGRAYRGHSTTTISKRAVFFVCGEDGGIYRVEKDSERWRVLPALERHDSPATSICTHPFNARYPHLGDIAVTSSFDWSIRLWSMGRRGPCLPLQKFVPHHLHATNDVQWNPTTPGVFAVGDAGGGVSLYDLSSGTSNLFRGRFTWCSEGESATSSAGGEVSRVSWNRDGLLLAAGTDKGALHLWQASDRLSNSGVSSWENVSASVKRWHDAALNSMCNEKELPKQPSYVFDKIPPIVNPHYAA